MKRQVYMNFGTNVQMYATESPGGHNPNNCASGCSGCNGTGQGGNTSLIGRAIGYATGH